MMIRPVLVTALKVTMINFCGICVIAVVAYVHFYAEIFRGIHFRVPGL